MKQTRLVKILLGSVASAAAFGLALAQADIDVRCSTTYTVKGKKTQFCVTLDDGTTAGWVCTKNKDGTWGCVSATKEFRGGIPPDLKKAVLDAKARNATGGEKTGR